MTTAHKAVTTTINAGTGVYTFTWGVMDSDDDGVAIEMAPNRDYFVQFVGTWGSGGSVSMEGSYDGGTTYGILKDLGGNAITATAVGKVFHIYTKCPLLKPVVTAGDGSTAIQAIVVAYPVAV